MHDNPVIELARNGALKVTVRARSGAPAAEEYAAEELRRHLQEMTRAGPCRRFRFHAAPHRIFINDREAAAQSGLDVPADLGVEEFLIATQGPDLHVLGGGPRGVLYGVYHLLESLGCRWFTPEISRIPKRRTLRLAPLSVRAKPAFEYRDNFNWDTGDPVWRVRNRFNGWHTPLPDYMGGQVTYGDGLFVHTHFSLVPPELLFDQHPEFFAMQGGRRRRDAGQLCMSNREAMRVAAEEVLRRMRAEPRATIFSVSQMDGGGYCECPDCNAVAAEEGAQSANALRFANAVAEITSREFPDKLIDTLAYGWTVDAPRHTRPHPNVRVRLCSIATCLAHPLGTCADDGSGLAGNGAQFLRALEAWGRMTNQLHIWHYCTDFSHSVLPVPNFEELQGNIALFKRHKAYGIFMQGFGDEGGGAESQLLRGYLIGKLLWDPKTPLWSTVDDFLGGCYGRAATPVRRYYDIYHQRLREDRRFHFSLYEPPASRLFDEDLVAPADTALAEGERLVRGPQRFRVRLLRDGLAYARLCRALPTAYRLQEDTYGPTGDSGALSVRLDKLEQDWRRAGKLFMGEGNPTKDVVTSIRRRLRSHPVDWLRDGDRAVAILPTLCGQILEWRCHGRQWLVPAIPEDFAYPSPAGYMEIPGHVYNVFQCRRCGDSLQLNTRLNDGLRITRTLTLTGNTLAIVSRIVNRSEKTVRWSWGARTFLAYPGAGEVAFQSATGPQRIAWGDIPQTSNPPHGARAFEEGLLPNGEWRVIFAGFTVTHRFSGHSFIRTTLGRSDQRQGLSLYVCTDNLNTAPGDGIEVRQELTIEKT
ncbi:MAG: hypothetical protein PCFJNLEI_00652 [Verrucomicrobiae bacterium]|nr:hypothetical protein [Verrucomicrobiae bacterium]